MWDSIMDKIGLFVAFMEKVYKIITDAELFKAFVIDHILNAHVIFSFCLGVIICYVCSRGHLEAKALINKAKCAREDGRFKKLEHELKAAWSELQENEAKLSELEDKHKTNTELNYTLTEEIEKNRYLGTLAKLLKLNLLLEDPRALKLLERLENEDSEELRKMDIMTLQRVWEEIKKRKAKD